MSIEALVNDVAQGFSPEILLAKNISTLYTIMIEKIDLISEVTGFEEVDISVTMDEDNCLVRANPDFSNVAFYRSIYATGYSPEALKKSLERKQNPQHIRNTEIGIPYRTCDIFEMPRNSELIQGLIDTGILPENIFSDLEAGYNNQYCPLRLKSGKTPRRIEDWRGGLHVPLFIGRGQPYGIASFSCITNDAKKHPLLAGLGERDSIPEEYKQAIRKITKEFAPVITFTIKLYDEQQAKKTAEIERDAKEQALQRELALRNQIVEKEKYEQIALLSGGILHDAGNILSSLSASIRVATFPYRLREQLLKEVSSLSERLKSVKSVDEIPGIVAQYEALANHSFFAKLAVGAGKEQSILPTLARATGLVQSLKTDYTFNNQPITLEPIIDESLQDLETKLEKIKIERTYQGDTEYRVLGDQMQLGRVYSNIVDNAVEALTSTDQPAIHITTRIDEGRHVVEITDNGTGISAANLGKVFDPYFSTKPLKGSRERGLGCYVAKQIIQAHKGKIEATSVEGEGTTITIYLPLQKN